MAKFRLYPLEVLVYPKINQGYEVAFKERTEGIDYNRWDYTVLPKVGDPGTSIRDSDLVSQILQVYDEYALYDVECKDFEFRANFGRIVVIDDVINAVVRIIKSGGYEIFRIG